MNKDAILATVIGFVIGLTITGLILVGPKVAKYLPKISIHIPAISFMKSKPTPTQAPKQKAFSLTVDSPIPDSIASEGDLLVSGTTASGATVVIQGNIDDAVVTATSEGKFAGKIALVEGQNDITVTSYREKDRASQTVTVYYTEEQF